MNKSKVNLMDHKPYTITIYGPWKCQAKSETDQTWIYCVMKVCVDRHKKSEIWTQIKLLETLSSRNVDGHRDAKICEKTEKGMPL